MHMLTRANHYISKAQYHACSTFVYYAKHSECATLLQMGGGVRSGILILNVVNVLCKYVIIL